MPEIKDVNTLPEVSPSTENPNLNVFVYDNVSNSGYGISINDFLLHVSSNIDVTPIVNNLELLKSYVGNLGTLSTINKASTVDAINEVYSGVGNKNNLSTSTKTNLVNALNEVNNKVGNLPSLKTNQKGNAVGAINELAGYIDESNFNTYFPGKTIPTALVQLDKKIGAVASSVPSSSSSSISSSSSGSSGFGLNENSGIYYASDSIIPNKNDCTSTLQKLVDTVYSNGGGVIQLDKGDYYLHSLTLKPGVSLEGAGKGVTVLHRLNGNAVNPSTATTANSKSNKFNSNKAFIFIPMNVSSFTIKNLSIVGNYDKNIWSDSHKRNKSYYDTEVVDGIKFEDFYRSNGDEASSETPITTDNPYGQIDDYEGLTHGMTSTNSADIRCYKNCLIDDVAIIGFSGNGIYIGKGNYSVVFGNFYASYNLKNGIQNNSSDNFFYCGMVEHNCQHGIFDLGGNCKFTDMKVIWNGDSNHSAEAIHCEGVRNTYVNVEIQDNYSTGLYLGGRDNIFTNITADCNGYKGGWNATRQWVGGNSNTPQDCSLIHVTGKRNHLTAICTQYKKDYGMAVAGWSLKVEGATGCILEVTDDTKINGASFGCSKNGAVIDGTKINSQLTPQSLKNNSILYIACNT